jgi:hypothetical protein
LPALPRWRVTTTEALDLLPLPPRRTPDWALIHSAFFVPPCLGAGGGRLARRSHRRATHPINHESTA